MSLLVVVTYNQYFTAAAPLVDTKLGTLSPKHQVAIKGKYFTIFCHSVTKPNWTKGNSRVTSGGRIKKAGYLLHVTDVNYRDADSYHCSGWTKEQSFIARAVVKVGSKDLGVGQFSK